MGTLGSWPGGFSSGKFGIMVLEVLELFLSTNNTCLRFQERSDYDTLSSPESVCSRFMFFVFYLYGLISVIVSSVYSVVVIPAIQKHCNT